MSPVPSAPAMSAARAVHVFYGTQTGNAQEIARRISAEVRGALPAQSLREASGEPPFAGGASGVAVIVVSTTGDGDPPDKIRPFMRFARNAAKDPASLSHVSYALLGLGDTNYENFCNTAKKIDLWLGKAGAKPVVPRGLADDGTGLEAVVEPWLAALPGALDAYFTVHAPSPPAAPGPHAATDADPVATAVAAVTAEELGVDVPPVLPPALVVADAPVGAQPCVNASPHYSAGALRATVAAARLLTPDAPGGRRVYHAELLVDDQPLAYAPGDAFGVLIENAPRDVARAVARVAYADRARDRAKLFQLRRADASGAVIPAASARDLLAQRVDLRAVPKKSILRALAEHCAAPDDREALLRLCARKTVKRPPLSAPEYARDVVQQGLSVLDVLDLYAPTCRPPLALLLDMLPPLAPRYYSAASAPEEHPNAVHFAFSLVRNGLATPRLAERCDKVICGEAHKSLPPVHIVPRASDASSTFRPPRSLETPYIMVGPGTGVAPFRGFLQSRAAQMAAEPGTTPGETMLFFGCRHEAHDFLYADELRAFEASGVLSVLDVAFSRDGTRKVYVQDRLRARGAQVAAALDGGASFFVCGDGGAMALGVDQALHALVAEHLCDGDAAAAKAYVKALAAEKRYVRDIWYFGKVDED